MRKNIAVLTAGIAASMMIISGCSSKATEETTVAAEVQTELAVETEAADTSEAEMSDAEVSEAAENGSEEAVGEESMMEIGLDVPIKIFGEINEVAEDMLVVDNQSEMSSMGEMELMIDPENTLILDAATGFPTSLEEVENGSFEAYIGPAMTMSLPPQTTPYVVVVNISEDAAAPQYVVSADVVMETANGPVLAGNDGSEYPLADDVVVEPFLTRNIVTLEDVHEGSRCLIWVDAQGEVEKLAVMAE